MTWMIDMCEDEETRSRVTCERANNHEQNYPLSTTTKGMILGKRVAHFRTERIARIYHCDKKYYKQVNLQSS